jgi:hypothetical protein
MEGLHFSYTKTVANESPVENGTAEQEDSLMFDPYAQPTTARNKRSNPLRTWEVYSVLF